MRYKNISSLTIENRGVIFKPGEVKDVPFSISSKHFISVGEDVEKPSPKHTRGRKPLKASESASSTKSETIKTDSDAATVNTTTSSKKESE